MRKLRTKKDAPAKQRGTWQKNLKYVKNSDKTTFDILFDAKVMPSFTPTRTEEREFVVDSGASMHITPSSLSQGLLEYNFRSNQLLILSMAFVLYSYQ